MSLCFYCAQTAIFSDKIEHIIPTAIGGTREFTGSAPPLLFTDRVCDRCNILAGKTIDRPFVETTIITTLRSLANTRNRGKRPPLFPFPSRIKWERPEMAHVFMMGAFFFVRLKTTTGNVYVEYYTASESSTISEDIRSQMEEIANTMVLNGKRLSLEKDNDQNIGDIHQDLIDVFGTANPIRSYPSETTDEPESFIWEAAKITLGICCGLSEAFVTSNSANALRAIAFREISPIPYISSVEVASNPLAFLVWSSFSPSAKHHVCITIQGGVIQAYIAFYDVIWVRFLLKSTNIGSEVNNSDMIFEVDQLERRSYGINIPRLL